VGRVKHLLCLDHAKEIQAYIDKYQPTSPVLLDPLVVCVGERNVERTWKTRVDHWVGEEQGKGQEVRVCTCERGGCTVQVGSSVVVQGGRELEGWGKKKYTT